MYAVKELSRDMAGPTETNCRARKRLGRYLKQNPTYVSKYPYQQNDNDITVYADTDHAGCLRARRSLSGGTSSTQKGQSHCHLARESTMVLLKGAGGLGCGSCLADLGMRAGIEIVEVNTDASAALGI